MYILILYSILCTTLLHIYGLYKFALYCINTVKERSKHNKAMSEMKPNIHNMADGTVLNHEEWKNYMRKYNLKLVSHNPTQGIISEFKYGFKPLIKSFNILLASCSFSFIRIPIESAPDLMALPKNL